MSAIEACRTAALGGYVSRCENEKCAHTVIAYCSCRNRHCPKCQGSQALAWMAERKAGLLQVPYFHIVFTLPAEVGAIAYQNKAVIYDLLFKAASDTILTIAADPQHLGAKIGITAVLHTWGSAMTHHPHVHMIVTGGGISPEFRRKSSLGTEGSISALGRQGSVRRSASASPCRYRTYASDRATPFAMPQLQRD